MVYKSPKAASLYSEFANSKNLKEAKIMPGTLTFSVVNWKESDAECTFTVVNSGFGYTTQLQNKYYHTSFGLFILTNNTFFFDIYAEKNQISGLNHFSTSQLLSLPLTISYNFLHILLHKHVL